jgi:altronate hydrolase
VGAVLLVSLGCESFNRSRVADVVRASGRPVATLVIQETGGTRRTIRDGQEWVKAALEKIRSVPRVPMGIDELVVGTTCGGSDSTSGLTANPAVGLAFDRLVDDGAAVMFEELGELIGCDYHMAARAVTPELGQEILKAMAKTRAYYENFGHSSIAVGNYEGGLSTIEEKSLGAYAKAGSRKIAGMIKPGDVPPKGGLYLMDMIPDGDPKFGFPDVNDNAEIVEMIASGCHLTIFTTGRGSVVGSAIAPVIKICANPETFRKLEDDMDIDAGRILEGRGTLEEVGRELYELALRVAAGEPTKSEALGHQEFLLWYKNMEALGPACLPMAR